MDRLGNTDTEHIIYFEQISHFTRFLQMQRSNPMLKTIEVDQDNGNCALEKLCTRLLLANANATLFNFFSGDHPGTIQTHKQHALWSMKKDRLTNGN